jgi:N-acetylglucosaminyldiphosphoundecaprenol N-acetyl-beta-D-mannosaminyltransferase
LTFISNAVTIPCTMTTSFETVDLCGMALASLRSEQLIAHIFEQLQLGKGGWLITANLDFLRRFVRDPAARSIYADADLRVADGMPLVWASHVQGTPLPERVAGSSLLVPICQAAARDGRSVYLLGGDPNAAPVAAERLCEKAPGLKIVGISSPQISAEVSEAEIADLRATLRTGNPALVFVAFGSPKQERVIARLRAEFPETWWIGVGISFSFLAGQVQRAPQFVQRLGLEWVHRLAQEPERLFRRYIIEDLPFAFELFGRAALSRVRGQEARR